MKWVIIMLTVLLGFMLYSPSASQDPFEEQWKGIDEDIEQKWETLKSELEQKWDELERQQQEEWRRAKEEIESKWDRYVESTRKVWVDYAVDLNARSQVNFEKGYIEITSIVPTLEKKIVKVAKEEIEKQVKKIFSEDNPARIEVLRDQVRNKKGEAVTKDNLDEFIKEEVIKKSEIEKRPFMAKDGIERMKVKTLINMVPDHIFIRAKKYLPVVSKESDRFELRSQLVLAIIHTESFFNPLARSSEGAYGLMQLIPRHAARDAYRYLYKRDEIITPTYLYDPQNNIELGTTYVYLLKTKHFSGIADRVKNRYLTICAYNWGPTAVNDKIVGRYNISDITAPQLYEMLMRSTPGETSDYLKKVTERIAMYDSLINR